MNPETLTNHITIQMNQISTNMQRFEDLMTTINNLIIEKKDEKNLEFSRIDTDVTIKCNFCTKTSYYQDINNKYYCWFHRSQYE
jgi:hypothetical protein